MNEILTHFDVFILVTFRTVAFIMASPLISISAWPNWAKIGLAFGLSYVVTPTITSAVPDVLQQPGTFIVDGLLEACIGLLLGFIATMIFSAISIAGQAVDIQIGFSMASLFSPGSNVQSGIFGNLYNLLFTLYFLGMGGLDGLMMAITHSFVAIPLAHFQLPNHWPDELMQLMNVVMTLALEIAAPLLASLFMSDVTFAFLSRAVPQMNVFVVGLPVKIFVGLLMFAVVMPGTIYMFNRVFMYMFSQLQVVQNVLGG
ncbi:flagellar biosynthetic protein FliR [Alicyclobacillus acidiphilus]|uniref:flagellar biosynthetic protein FliR n=1 Tax=Alicyclobacillus acidiphilus TaxID=182455 RepID=UPI00082B8030|nr:flagellar biosynthetic protein FliR [Alicyclobacillus acidiphilus]